MEKNGKCKKNREIKLVTADQRWNKLALERIYHAIKWFPKNLVAIKTRKAKTKFDKPVYLGMSILDISKAVTYQ